MLFSHWVTPGLKDIFGAPLPTLEKDTECDHFSPWMVFLALKWDDQSQGGYGKLMRATHCVWLICLVNSGSKEEQHGPPPRGWNMKALIHNFYFVS